MNLLDQELDGERGSTITEVADLGRSGAGYTDPDGTTIRFVVPGEEAIGQVGVTVDVSDLRASLTYYVHTLGWDQTASVRCGRSVIRLRLRERTKSCRSGGFRCAGGPT